MAKKMKIQPLWTPLSDALKLILNGSTAAPLSESQEAIYEDVIAKASHDDSGKRWSEPALPGVATRKQKVNNPTQPEDTLWYIPDLIRYMLSTFTEWSILNPPLALDFINRLVDENGNYLFAFSTATGYRRWEASNTGQAYWDLVCKKQDLQRDLDELAKTHHHNDPLRFETKDRLREDLTVKLRKVEQELNSGATPRSAAPKKVPGNSIYNWEQPAREKGERILEKFPHLNLLQIAKKVRKEMMEEQITGRGDRVPSAEAIKRHALIGLKGPRNS